MGTWVEAKIIEKKRWTERLFSLRFESQALKFKAGQFVRIGLDIGGERVARPYSCVNPPQEPVTEIYFNLVPEGPLTNALVKLEPGDSLWVWDSLNGFLVIDEVPECRHLWMCATGTGIGPFISILRTAEPWQRFERIMLVHAVRQAKELVYRDLIDEAARRHPQQFHYIPVVSREQTDFALHGRIPALIEDGSLERRAGCTLSAADSHVMLCGNSGMIKEVTELLQQRGMQRHTRREPGHITTEKYH